MITLKIALFAAGIQGPIVTVPFDTMAECQEAIPKAGVYVHEDLQEHMRVKIQCEEGEPGI